MSEHQGSSFWAATNYICSLVKASSELFLHLLTCLLPSLACLPAHPARNRDQSAASPSTHPPAAQPQPLPRHRAQSASYVNVISHNPQTSGTSLEQCPCKIKSLTNSNQYFHYRIKLAFFCFTSNPNCFLSTNWPAQGSDLNTICHCLPKPNQLTYLSLSTPGQGAESCHGFASSKPQNNIFNTVEPDRFLCWRSFPWQSLMLGIQNSALWIKGLFVSLGLFPRHSLGEDSESYFLSSFSINVHSW